MEGLIILEKVDERQLISLVSEGLVAVRLDFCNEFENFKGVGFYKGPTKKRIAEWRSIWFYVMATEQ